MKLTASQIAKIEETLALNQVIFEDIKLELTDHIASEIEVVLIEKECSFEEALVTVFEKWSPELKPSRSFWTNLLLPKFVLNKYEMESRNQNLITITGACLGTFLLISCTYKSTNQFVIESIKYFFQTLFALELSVVLYFKIRIKKSKKATFYSMLYQNQTTSILAFLILLTIGIWSVRLGTESLYRQIITNFIVFCYLLLPLLKFKFALRHFKIVQKLKNC